MNKIPIREDLKIETYKDFQKNKYEIFNILSETMDLILQETAEKNPKFLLPFDIDSLVDIKDFHYDIPVQ